MTLPYPELIPFTLDQWKAQTLRLTTFHENPQLDNNAITAMFLDVTGHEPDGILRRRDIVQADGVFSERRLLLAMPMPPHRVDWIVTDTPESQNIASVEAALSDFQRLIGHWLTSCPPVTRMAFGIITLISVPNRQLGYKYLANYLPSVTINPDRSNDLLYRINRPRTIDIQNNRITINRLSSWQVPILSAGHILMTSGRLDFVPQQEATALQVELDINTSQDTHGELPREQLENISQQLVHMATEILREGDIE